MTVELEVLSQEWIDNNVVHVRGLGDIIEAAAVENLLVPKKEVLTQEWIDEHSVAVAYDGMPDQTEIVYVDELEQLINSKKEEA